MNMNKILLIFGLVAVLSVGLFVPGSHASRTTGRDGFKPVNNSKLIGAAVEDTCGKVIGVVNEVMVDSRGHAFAVINHGDYDLYGDGGVNTPVPIEALKIVRKSRGREIAFLKTDMEHLDFAPYLSPLQTNNRQEEATIYEYYGIQPYWSEKTHSGAHPSRTGAGQKRTIDPYRWGGEAQDF
jgi:hypothetical protein